MSRMEEKTRSASMARRSNLPGARMCSCPTNSSKVCGRMRAASGASCVMRSAMAWSNRSMRGVYHGGGKVWWIASASSQVF